MYIIYIILHTRNQPAGAWWAPQAEKISIAVAQSSRLVIPDTRQYEPDWKTSHGWALGPLPTFYGRREQFPLDPGVLPSVRIPVAIILRYPAHLVGVPSGGCLSATWHHYLGRNNSKGEHRRVRVPPNRPSTQVFCNISRSYRVGSTESAVEQHNKSLTGHII